MPASAEQLPFPNNSFDTVVGTLVFCTIPYPEQALGEIRRVCKSEGQILLFEHVRLDHPFYGRLQDWLTPFWKKLCDGCHLNRNTLSIIEKAGFTITHVKHHYKGLFFVVEAINKKS